MSSNKIETKWVAILRKEIVAQDKSLLQLLRRTHDIKDRDDMKFMRIRKKDLKGQPLK